jgi:hypothetical protein
MTQKRISPLSKLALLTLGLALFLQLTPALSPTANAADPCSGIPGLCKPTWDPVTRCCISDPRFDCIDFCY